MADKDYLIVPRLHTKHLTRIFSKIRVDQQTGCWVWTGSLNTAGYGANSVANIRGPIHRLLYAWLVEPIPKGLGRGIPQLDHVVCDRRSCVNPSHLKLTTARENVLRGTSMAAKHAARTHCNRGHLFPPGNNRPAGGRRCLLCKRDARQLAMHREAQRRYIARHGRHSTTQKKDGAFS
jgi:hypothetical protein